MIVVRADRHWFIEDPDIRTRQLRKQAVAQLEEINRGVYPKLYLSEHHVPEIRGAEDNPRRYVVSSWRTTYTKE